MPKIISEYSVGGNNYYWKKFDESFNGRGQRPDHAFMILKNTSKKCEATGYPLTIAVFREKNAKTNRI